MGSSRAGLLGFRRAVTALSAVLVVICISTPAEAQSNYSLIKGSVFTPEGLAYPGAKVTVVRGDVDEKQQKKTRKETYSDRAGEFAFRLDVGPAKYRLTIEAKGFPALVREVEIASDERTDISIVLKK